MTDRKKIISMLALLLAAVLLLAGCSASDKSPKPEKGSAGTKMYAEVFEPLLEGFFWGMQIQDIPNEYALATDEAIRGDGILTVPIAIYVKVFDTKMTVWLKFDEGSNGGLYEMTLRFEPELYPDVRDCMIEKFGPYQIEGDPEKSVFFQSRKLSDYYTEKEIRENYMKIVQEKELTDENVKELLESSEFVYSVRSGGTIGMSARTHLAMKNSMTEE